MERKFVGRGMLAIMVLLTACNSFSRIAATPVQPDATRPTFVFFFTDP
jgi:hypothetical protein